jgi:hypothetical protein
MTEPFTAQEKDWIKRAIHMPAHDRQFELTVIESIFNKLDAIDLPARLTAEQWSMICQCVIGYETHAIGMATRRQEKLGEILRIIGHDGKNMMEAEPDELDRLRAENARYRYMLERVERSSSQLYENCMLDADFHFKEQTNAA